MGFDIDNLERVKKTEDQIIDRLILDTKRGKLHWYADNYYIYTRMINIFGDNRIDTIFRISDEEEGYGMDNYFGYEYQDLFSNIVTLEIYMSKNQKKEIFCKRISAYQTKLNELLATVMPVVIRKIPNKK